MTDTEKSPIMKLKEMIETGTQRERVIRPSEKDPKEVEFVEKKSLALIAMNQSDMANIAIEFMENSILHQPTIPGEKLGSPDSETSSNEETGNASENEGSILSRSSMKR